MSKSTKLIIAAVLFLIYGFIAIYSGFIGGGAERAEAKLQSATQSQLEKFNSPELSVEMNGQHATITGIAGNSEDRMSIIEAVRSARWSGGLVSGGVTVVDAANLKIAAPRDKPVGPFIWTADKQHTVVELTGLVPSEIIRKDLVSHAQTLFPDGVVDKMTVGRGVPVGDWPGAAKRSLEALAKLQSGRVTGNGAAFTLVGVAKNDALVDAAQERLLEIPIGFTSEDTIKVPKAVAVRSPYNWGVNYEGDNEPIILTGFAPNRETADDILQHTKARFPRKRVIDSMVIAAGKPEGNWVEMVKYSIDNLSLLDSGRAEGVDRAFKVIGIADSEAVADQVRGAMARLPDTIFNGAAELSVLPVVQINQVDECQSLFNQVKQSATINFGNAEAVILPDSYGILDRLVNVVKQCSAFEINIEGHTDSSGSAAFNQRLSQDRASAVVDYLVSKGVSRAQMVAQGFGETRPIGDNSTPEGKALNRRIEFTIKNKEG